jgi:hypothetical protein
MKKFIDLRPSADRQSKQPNSVHWCWGNNEYNYRVFRVQADWTLIITSHKGTKHNTIEASITLDGVTLTDSLIRWSPNEWPSVCGVIPQCLPIRCSRRLISLHSDHSYIYEYIYTHTYIFYVGHLLLISGLVVLTSTYTYVITQYNRKSELGLWSTSPITIKAQIQSSATGTHFSSLSGTTFTQTYRHWKSTMGTVTYREVGP